jgi:hypothetical protein
MQKIVKNDLTAKCSYYTAKGHKKHFPSQLHSFSLYSLSYPLSLSSLFPIPSHPSLTFFLPSSLLTNFYSLFPLPHILGFSPNYCLPSQPSRLSSLSYLILLSSVIILPFHPSTLPQPSLIYFPSFLFSHLCPLIPVPLSLFPCP